MPITTIEKLGALLRERREHAALDIQTAATRAGVGRRLLLELEAGKRPNVSFSTVLRLLALFGLKIDVVPRGLPGTAARNAATPTQDKR
jgi:transcriptional regulator with XRE-family HTH domain